MPVSKRVTVPKSFIEDFETVAERYQLRETGEYDEAKAAARADLDNALVCFASLAREDA